MCYYMSSATFWDFAAIAAIDASADIAAIAAFAAIAAIATITAIVKETVKCNWASNEQGAKNEF